MAGKEVAVRITATAKDAEAAFRSIASAAESASSRIAAASAKAKSALSGIDGGTGKVSASLGKIGSAASSAGSKISSGMKQAQTAMKKATQSVMTMNSAMNALAGAAALGIAGSIASGIAGIGVSCVQAAGQMEQYEIAFQTMLKSTEKGTAMLRDLQDFAAKTPFDVPGVVETAQQLMAFGFAAKDIIPTLRTLGDASAGLGKGSEGVKQMGYALGQISTSGTLKTQDVNQLATAGINVWQALSESYGKSITEIKEMTEKGMIDSADAVKIITDSMNENFGGMMVKMETSINGLFSNITETAGTFASTVGAYMVDAFNIKDKMAGVSEFLGEITQGLQAAQQQGKSFTQAIADCVPREIIDAFGALAAVIGVTLVGAVGAAFVAIGAALGLAAPVVAAVVAVAAAVGALAARTIVYWDDMKEGTKSMVDAVLSSFTDFAAGAMTKTVEMAESVVGAIGDMWESAMGYTPAWVSDVENACNNALSAISSWASSALSYIHEVFAAQQQALDPNDSYWASSFANTDDDNEAIASAIPKYETNSTASVSSGGASRGGGGSSGTADLSRKETELSRLNEALAKSSAATQELSKSWNDMAASINFDSLSGSDQVYQKIEDEKNARLTAIDEALAKQKAAVDEAEAYRQTAMQTGDASALANAEALYTERNARYQQALQQAEGYETASGERILGLRAQVEQQAAENALSIATQLEAAKAEMQAAMREGSHESFLEYLNSESEAQMVALEQEQELRQQLLDWRMESQQTMLDFELQAAESLKNSLASGFAELITEGGSFSDKLKEIAKNIVNMFVQFMVKRQAAAALENMLRKKEEAETVAAAQAEGAALAAPAVQKSIAVCGPLAGPPAYAGATAAMGAIGIAAVLALIGSFAKGGRAKGLALVGEEGPELVNFARPGMVYTAGETESILSSGMSADMISMAGYRAGIASGGAEASGISINATLNNYGDINTGADAEDLLEDFSGAILAGLRGG